MTAPWNSTSRRVALALTVLGLGIALFSGCGGDSGGDGAARLAKQEELRAAREEAARDARQGVKIAELERRLNRRNAASAASTVPARSSVPADEEEPLAGLWKGEATIRYESGESAPFNQTIEIDSLIPGSVSGYSEARQGSTTCHGPLTYEGVADGWYRFRADERNVAECIDQSVVELMPAAGGDLVYRETTDVSVSSGTLGRDG